MNHKYTGLALDEMRHLGWKSKPEETFRIKPDTEKDLLKQIQMLLHDNAELQASLRILRSNILQLETTNVALFKAVSRRNNEKT